MRSSRRWPWVLLVLLVALLGFRAALPLLAELALERVLSGALRARVEIGDVDLDLLGAEIVVAHATLRAEGTGAELAELTRLALDADWAALASGRFEAERIALERPRLLLAYDAEGSFNWADVLGAGSEAEGEEEGGAVFRVRVGRAEVSDGELALMDDTADGLPNLRLGIQGLVLEGLELARDERGSALRWGLDSAEARSWQIGIAPDRGDPLEFQVRARTAALTPEGVLPIDLEASREGGGRLAVRGELRPQPLGLVLDGSWEGLRSTALLPLLQVGGMRVDRGSSDGELDLALTLEEVPERGLRVRGRASHRDLALTIGGEAPAELQVARIELELEEFRLPIPVVPADPPEPIVVHWSRIEIVEPALEITLPEVAAKREREAEGGGGGPPTEIDVRVDELSVRDGRATWRDRELGVDHEQTVAPVVLEASQLRWPRVGFERLRLEAGGVGPEPVRLEGSWVGSSADADLRATRVSLPPWNAAIRYYTDYSVSRGALSLRSHFRLRGEDYEAPTRVTLHDLVARSEGDAFQNTFGVPMATAIRLLKDPAGNIELQVPVHGTLSEGARVDLVPAVAEALRGSIGGALASAGAVPLDVTGALIRRVSEVAFLGLGEVRFGAGGAEMAPASRLVLDSAAGVAGGESGARIRLVSEVVSDDLRALGLAGAETGVLGSALAVGRALVGGGSKVEGKSHARLAELSKRRFEAIQAYLSRERGFEAARIVREPWDGKVREGLPRVLLRLETGGS